MCGLVRTSVLRVSATYRIANIQVHNTTVLSLYYIYIIHRSIAFLNAVMWNLLWSSNSMMIPTDFRIQERSLWEIQVPSCYLSWKGSQLVDTTGRELFKLVNKQGRQMTLHTHTSSLPLVAKCRQWPQSSLEPTYHLDCCPLFPSSSKTPIILEGYKDEV